MKPTTSRSTQRREALYALAMAENMPDAGVLDDIVRQYPQFSRELTEFAVELALDSLVESGTAEAAADPTKVSPAVSRAMTARSTIACLPCARHSRRGWRSLHHRRVSWRIRSRILAVGNSERWPNG